MTETVQQCPDIRDCLKGLQCCSVGLACSHLDMEFSEVSSLGERIVLKLRLGCDTAQHKETKRQPVNTGPMRGAQRRWKTTVTLSSKKCEREQTLTADLVNLLHHGLFVLRAVLGASNSEQTATNTLTLRPATRCQGLIPQTSSQSHVWCKLKACGTEIE